MVKVAGFTKKNKNDTYPDCESALKPVPHMRTRTIPYLFHQLLLTLKVMMVVMILMTLGFANQQSWSR